MKMIALVMLIVGTALVHAQDQSAKWDQDYQESKTLAAKLYPDLLHADSDLAKACTMYHKDIVANGTSLTRLSTWPLILAIYTAGVLHDRPALENLTDSERYEVFLAMQYNLGHTKDFAFQQDGSGGQTQNAAPSSSDSPAPDPSHAGYVFYFNYLSHQSHWNSTNPAAARASGGVFSGMDWGQAQNKAQQLWEALSMQDQQAYEQKAQTYGSGPDPAKATDLENNFNVNITHDQNQ